jgi:C4-dicarboxylate transporter DctM subunit
MITGFLFVLLFLLLYMGVPIAIGLGLSSVVTILLFGRDSLASLVLKLFQTSEHFTLAAIPFFLLSGAFLTTGGVAKRLIEFANACVSHVRGGLAIASIFACTLFAAVSGSSPATVVAVGTIAIAGMVRAGYTKEFAAGLICNAGTLGILIPPSIPMVVFAAATNVSLGRMFIAGIIPGLILSFMLMATVYALAHKYNLPSHPWRGWGHILKTGREAIWGLFLIVIILGGIYGGVFTPTEAAAVAAIYAMFVALFIYRDINWRQAPKVLVDSGKMTVMLMFIIANAMLFGHVLTTERIPHIISEALVGIGMTPWMFLLVVNIILIIAGDFMEPTAIILITAPIFFPIAVNMGIDPVHFGIMVVVNMEIGMVTPPVGLNLYVTSAITGMNIVQVLKAALPWMTLLLVFLGLITYVPILSTVLPDYVYGGPERVMISK